ncbi:hypothetical protein O4H66_24420, partial [Comamonadaceae bacterium G21597-S1]|nr:hypothetical protein [Comamonadaceae bacterium G21597-S1]
MLLTGLTAEIRKAALQFTSTESHCRHWQRKSLGTGLQRKRASTTVSFLAAQLREFGCRSGP